MMMIELKEEDYACFSSRIEKFVPFFHLAKKQEFADNFPENLNQLSGITNPA